MTPPRSGRRDNGGPAPPPRGTPGTPRRSIVRDPSALSRAWALEYVRLAQEVAAFLPSGPCTLVEAGCGEGALTVPLARVCPKSRIDAIDRFAPPYAPARSRLFAALSSAQLAERVRVHSGDAVTVLGRRPSRSRDAVVSSEFLSELDAPCLVAFFTACHRVLKVGGVTVHAFLSPVPRSPGQELTIEADSDPRWTVHSPAAWFSPPPGVARRSLTKAGFAHVEVRRLESRLRFVDAAARGLLKEWGVREAFYQYHKGRLRSEGLELPDWTIVSGARRR